MRERLEKNSGGKINWAAYFLVSIILFHLINNYIWLRLDQTYLLDDAHWHFLFSFRIFDLLSEHTFPYLSDISNNYFAFRWHGILVGYLTAPFYFILGLTQDSAVMASSSIFFTILILSLYGVGRVLFDKKTGLLSAFLVSMYPLVFNHMRTYMLDLPLTSMVVLSVFLLLKSESFTNKKYSCFFAIASGLGLLIKFNFALFILGPLAVILCKILCNFGFKKAWRNIAMVIFIAALISFRFYGLKFWEIANRIYSCSWFYAVGFYPEGSPISILQRCLVLGKDYLFFFLRDCFNNSVSPVLFILFIFGAVVNKRQRGILFAWLALPILLLAFLFHYPDQSRYFMPVLPALALISGAGIMGLNSAKLRRILVALVVILGCLQYFAVSYKIDFFPKQIQIKIPLIDNKFFPIMMFKRDLNLEFRGSPDTASYPAETGNNNEEILNEILMNSRGQGPQDKVKVFFMGNNVRIYQPIMYEVFIRKLPIDISHLSLSEEEKYKDQSLEVYNMLRADYVAVTKQRLKPSAPFFVKRRLRELSLFFERNIAKFALIKELNFNNGDSFLLYKRIKNYTRIAKDSLEFCFRDGVARIIYHGREITRAVGLGASFSLEGGNYTNPYLQWDSELVSPENLTIYAKTEGLPFLMKWEVFIKNNQEIIWKVSIDGELWKKVDDLYLTLFLTAGYTQWLSPSGKRMFASKNIHAFEEIELPDLTVRSVTLSSPKEKTLPRVIFSVDNLSDAVPFIRWRNDLRGVGFYIKTKDGSLDKRNIFSGTISFK